MKSPLVYVAAILVWLPLIGCAQKVAPVVSASSRSTVDIKTWQTPFAASKLLGLDQGGSVEFQPLENGALLFWSDAMGASGRSFGQQGVTKCDYSFHYRVHNYPKGLAKDQDVKVAFELTGETPSGRVTIDDQYYDLANGSLFLVSALGGHLRVKQLDRDLNQLREILTKPAFDSAPLIAYGKNDREIKTFFSQTANRE